MAKKEEKTNAMRMLDKAKLNYDVRGQASGSPWQWGREGIVTRRRYKGSFGGADRVLFPASNSSYTPVFTL